MFLSTPQRQQQGFTIIEIMVSLSIFALVAVVALGAFLKVMDSGKKAQAFKTIINNLSFTMESFSREARVGTVYDCYSTPNPNNPHPFTISNLAPTGCAAGNAFIFKSQRVSKVGGVCNLVYGYQIIANQVYKAQQTDCGDNSLDANDFTPITSSGVIIDPVKSHFVVTYDSVGGINLPRATLVLYGATKGKEKVKTEYRVQTTVTPRIIQ